MEEQQATSHTNGLVANCDRFNGLKHSSVNPFAFTEQEMKQLKTDERVDAILDILGNNIKPKEGIFFNGQIFDAYILTANLIRQAKTPIVLIDNYVDDTVLVQLSKRTISKSIIDDIFWNLHRS